MVSMMLGLLDWHLYHFINSIRFEIFQQACGKGNNWRKAVDLMDEMKENNVLANQFTYSAAISACGNGGQWERALELLKQVRYFSNGF